MEDLSDRELERYLSDSNAAKWFCEFGLMEKTPDHSFFLQNPPEDWSGKACLKIFNIFKRQL